MQEQIDSGDVAARNRRRKSSQQQKPLEVNNKETKRLIDSLTQFKNKISTLSKSIDDILNTSQAVIKKQSMMEAYYQEYT